MSYPTDTKSIRVRARVIAVLRDIVEGDDYCLTPGIVWDNYKSWAEIQSDYALEVYFGDGGEPTPYGGLQMEEPFTIIIHGRISKSEDPPADVRKALRDVRKAIMDDAAATNLDGNALRVKLGVSRTDGGQEASLNSGWFEQEFSVIIAGAIQDL